MHPLIKRMNWYAEVYRYIISLEFPLKEDESNFYGCN